MFKSCEMMRIGFIFMHPVYGTGTFQPLNTDP
jgi:hypothetical protein